MGESRTSPSFEAYHVTVGEHRTQLGRYYAHIEELHLTRLGASPEEAVAELRSAFLHAVQRLRERGEPVPSPGSGRPALHFAPNDQVERLRPLFEDFWRRVLGRSYSTSFVSNESTIPEAWESDVPGGREGVIARVREVYGVDISGYYDEPLPIVLQKLQDARSSHNS